VFHYQVYGYVIASSTPITELLAGHSENVPDLRILFRALSDSSSNQGYTLRLVSQERLACGEPFAFVYEHSTAYLLRHTAVADFEVHKSGQQIVVYGCEGAAPGEVCLFLLGGVLSFALELRGIPCLHASAITAGDRAVAFLGDARAGKSTLAASFLQAGYPLLTDDILALDRDGARVRANSGYPQMRMWPEEAQHFVGCYEHLECVHPAYAKRRVRIGPEGWGAFCAEPKPLACLYLPKRRASTTQPPEVEITAVSPRDAVIELVRYSFAASLVEYLGLQRQRLDLFAQLVRQVPVRRLVYPSGFEHLPRVRQAILEDLVRVL